VLPGAEPNQRENGDLDAKQRTAQLGTDQQKNQSGTTIHVARKSRAQGKSRRKITNSVGPNHSRGHKETAQTELSRARASLGTAAETQLRAGKNERLLSPNHRRPKRLKHSCTINQSKTSELDRDQKKVCCP
jgi:hypothetical protein